MNNVYVVRSGMLKDFVGWEWENLKAFSDYDKAVEYHNTVAKQIEPDDYGINEDVDIETLTLE